jgi:hypothetical protein
MINWPPISNFANLEELRIGVRSAGQPLPTYSCDRSHLHVFNGLLLLTRKQETSVGQP